MPSKPALQSSESSTDDLSGSEDSSSSGLDDGENEQNTNKETVSKVSILSGHGTEDDDNENQESEAKNKSQSSNSGSGGGTKSGELSIEIKLGKDNEKSKTLLAGSSFRALASSFTSNKSAISNTGENL